MIDRLLTACLTVAVASAVGLAAQNPRPTVAPNQRPGEARPPAQDPGKPGAALPSLLVGDAAPPLTIQTWYRGDAITKFEPGRVYIVEFWATWCAPCARCIAPLSELEKRFKPKGLSVIGVASQEVAASELEQYLAASGDAIDFRIALDDNGATNAAWMVAARQRGIPTAFVVDQASRIAWIGHPLDGLGAAVTQVIEGKHDLAAAAAAWRKRCELAALAEPIVARFEEHASAGEHDEAIVAADELLALDAAQFGEYAWRKFQVIAIGKKDEPAAYRWAEQAIEGVIKDNTDTLASLAAIISDDPRLQKHDFTIAGKAAARASTLSGDSRPDVLAILARVAAEAGDWPGAVQWQTRAVAAAPEGPSREELARRLEQYRKRSEQK